MVTQEVLTREKVTLLEAAAICGVSKRTIYNWLNDGKIQAVRTAGGSVRIFKDSLFKEVK